MAKPHRPAIFKWRHFTPEVILCAVRWYLRYSLSYRDVQELLIERGLEVDHTTVWRWVQHFAPELEERTQPHLKPTNKSWRVDETYVRIKGRWSYLYRARMVKIFDRTIQRQITYDVRSPCKTKNGHGCWPM